MAAPHLNINEKALLVNLVQKHKDVVESKVTNRFNVNDKDEAWRNIALEWSTNVTPPEAPNFKPSTSIRPRTAIQIKRAWANQKSRAKQETAAERRETFKTGGGKAGAVASEQSQKIRDMLQKQFDPLNNPYDDDAPIPSSSSSQPPWILPNQATQNTKIVEVTDDAESAGVSQDLVLFVPPVEFRDKPADPVKKNSNAASYMNSIPNAPPPPGTSVIMSRNSKRKAEDFIIEKAEKEHDLRLSVLQNEKELSIKKNKIAEMEMKYWQQKLGISDD